MVEVVEVVDVDVVVDPIGVVDDVVVVVVVGSVLLCKMPGLPNKPFAHFTNILGHSTFLYLTFLGPPVVQPHFENNLHPLANSRGRYWHRSACTWSASVQPATH